MLETFQKFLQKIGIVNSKEVAEKGDVKTEHLEAATSKITELENNLETANQTISTKEGEITRLTAELKIATEATATEKARADKAEGEKATVEAAAKISETNLKRAVDALAGKGTYAPVSADKNEAEETEEKSYATSVDQELADARKKSNWKPSKN